MHLTVSREPDLIAATVSGRFDAHRVEEFDRRVIGLIDESRPHVYLDLSEVEFMDSSALAALVRTLKATLAHAGSTTIVEVSDAVRIILELTRLDEVFRVAGTSRAGRVAARA
ncbi:STAS domain-containing protein [Microbacterium sp. NPDC077184]|uniref:STAS domain-containing protein n=1 Tax=Microbacterium sp. NPDC077184 TaxID=3154764 RepID=UPI0034292459